MKSFTKNSLSRRKFIGQASCAALGSTALYSTLTSLLVSNRLSAQSLPPASGHKALVCLLLQGGNDSFNMLAPRESDEFASYSTTRGEMGLALEDLLPITDSASGRAFGLHPNLTEIQSLYTSGDLAFVCNTGSLVEPTTLASYQNGSVKLPLGLFSHADQQMHWQTSTPDKRDSVGWLGRVADVLDAANTDPKVSMNISLSGTNILQIGNSIIPYAITDNGAIDLQFYGNENHTYFKGAVDSLLDQEYQNLLQRTYSQLNRNAINLGIVFNEAIAEGTSFSTVFPDTRLGRQFAMVARSIAAQGPLNQQRQTFLVNNGGWDTHDNHIEDHGMLLQEMSQAVGAFWTAIGELGLQDQVALFTASDFSRTLTNNGDGTDHGWGGNHFVIGGGVSGGRLHGDYPEDLSIGNDLDTGRGRLVPTLSVDEYFAEMALWLGAQNSNLPLMLPNLDRFYDPNSSDPPIGLWS